MLSAAEKMSNEPDQDREQGAIKGSAQAPAGKAASAADAPPASDATASPPTADDGDAEEKAPVMPPLEELMVRDAVAAEELKGQANRAFAGGHYDAAIGLYTRAIAENPRVPAYYTNRAFAAIRLERYGSAALDAERALALDPAFAKAHYRRAVCRVAMGRLRDAIRDFRAVVRAAPGDADARRRLTEAERELRREQFERAIMVEDSVPVEESMKADEIVVEPGYDGPTLGMEEPLTLPWIRRLLDHFRAQGRLHRKYAVVLLLRVLRLLRAAPTIVDITVPRGARLTICGDVHGQFYDLLHIFELNGLPSRRSAYLFNGDFVDRGSFSIECMLTLLALKLALPDHFFLSRGNHETIEINRVFGFQSECEAKYDAPTFHIFNEVFNAVPLGNVLNGRVLVVHGGLFSRDGVTMDEVRAIDRFRQPPEGGSLMRELLWSDPQDVGLCVLRCAGDLELF